MIESPRVRLSLAEYGRTIAVGLAIVAAVCLVLAIWTVLTPASETVPQRTDAQTIETELSHSAEVTATDAPWPQGTQLSDHPAYLINASPQLDLAIRTSAPPGSTVFHDARLRIEVVRDGDDMWEETRPLVSEQETATDGNATSTATIDIPELRERRNALQTQFAGVGTVQTSIVVETRYETDSYEGTLTASGPLSVTGRAYWIEGDPSASDSQSRTVTVTREAPVDWGTVIGLVVVGLLAVVGAAGAATFREEADIEWLQQELHRQRYDDWISDGELPMGVGSEYVALDSLKDVVDVAIDTNQRVVYDDRRDVFAVISGEVVYYYSRDGDWNRVAWPQARRREETESGPSFLEAFGMGDDETPEVEATPGPAEAGPPGGLDAEDASDEPGPDYYDPEKLRGEADTSFGPDDAGSAEGDDESDDGPASVFGGQADGDDEPPAGDAADDSVGPAERPPSERPFGGDEDEEDD